MKILVTAGATQVPIDQVRAITNIFTGKTGTWIATYFAANKNNDVVLVTSNPDFMNPRVLAPRTSMELIKYRTFQELAQIMEEQLRTGNFDVVIHSAAVSDYQVSRVCVLDETGQLVPVDSSTKLSSKHEKMYLELVPTFKIIDQIRTPWGFRGKLVKFKLQVGISDEELVEIARKSRADSDADMIVANCLAWSAKYAYIIGRDNVPERVSRYGLPAGIARRLQ